MMRYRRFKLISSGWPFGLTFLDSVFRPVGFLFVVELGMGIPKWSGTPRLDAFGVSYAWMKF